MSRERVACPHAYAGRSHGLPCPYPDCHAWGRAEYIATATGMQVSIRASRAPVYESDGRTFAFMAYNWTVEEIRFPTHTQEMRVLRQLWRRRGAKVAR